MGRDIIRIDGTAEHAGDIPPADQQSQYAAKYAECIGAMFGTAREFAELFSEALIITPSRPARLAQGSTHTAAGPPHPRR